MGKYLWMLVEADKYELPLAVADSARELGEMVGSNKHNVETNVCKGSNGRLSGVKYLKVLNYEDSDIYTDCSVSGNDGDYV